MMREHICGKASCTCANKAEVPLHDFPQKVYAFVGSMRTLRLLNKI